MMKLAALLLAAAAQAQQGPELTSENGHLLIRRQATTSVSDVDVRIAEAVGDARVAAGEAAYNATLVATNQMYQAIQELQGSTTSQMAAVTAALSTVTESVNSQLAAQNQQVNTAVSSLEAALTADVTSRINTLTSSIGGTVSDLSTTVGGSLSRINVQVAGSLSTGAANTGAAITSMNSTLVRSLASKADNKKHVWIGGCSRHTHGCWTDLCLNAVVFDTAAPKFRKQSNTRMQALIQGYFKVNIYVINESCSWAHTSLMIQGYRATHTHLHTSGWWWKDQAVNMAWKVNANQQMWIQVCGYCGRNVAHAYGTHQRQSFEYMGAFA